MSQLPKTTVHEPQRLLVLGDSQAGKTTCQAATLCPLQIPLSARAGTRPKIRMINIETRRYLTRAYQTFAQCEFPPATSDLTELTVRPYISGGPGSPSREYELCFLDMAGELHNTALSDDDPLHKRLLDAVMRARGIVYLVDMAIYYTVSPQEAARRLAVLRHNIDTFTSLAEEQGINLVEGKLPIRVALTLTKAERFLSSPEELLLNKRLAVSAEGRAEPELAHGADCAYQLEHEPGRYDARDPQAVEAFILSHEPHGVNLLETLRSFFTEVSAHVVSAVGMVKVNGVWLPNITLTEVEDRDGTKVLVERIRDPNKIQPIGLFDPFLHLLRDVDTSTPAAPPTRAESAWDAREEALMAQLHDQEPEDFSDLVTEDKELETTRGVRVWLTAAAAVLSAVFVCAVIFLSRRG